MSEPHSLPSYYVWEISAFKGKKMKIIRKFVTKVTDKSANLTCHVLILLCVSCFCHSLSEQFKLEKY